MKTRKIIDLQIPDYIPEGWEVHNAPRPLLGHMDLTGDFISGVFYVALDPNKDDYQEMVKFNQEMDAVKLVSISRDEVIQEMIEYYNKRHPGLLDVYDIESSDVRNNLVQAWFNLGMNIIE